MVQIPMITRDKLASSVVGTPELDTSGQKIGQSMAAMGEQVGQAAGEYAIDRQQQIDLAETNRLAVNYKMGVVNTFEQLKQQYADQPEKVGPLLMQSMQDQLANTQKQASNPRVNLMVGRGDPYFDTHLVMGSQDWALKQRELVDKTAVVNQANQVADKAEQIGSDPNTPYVVKKYSLLPLFSMAGNLTAGAFASAHPDSAAELQTKIGPTIMNRAFYGMLQSNPAQALQFTKEPEVQKAFESNPKELDEMNQKATQRLEGMAKEAKWNQAVQPLIDSPKLISQIASRQVDYNALDAMPEGPLKQQLQKMALDAYPVENGAQRDQAMSKFFADAADIGMNYKHVPSDKTASDLVKFNTELAKAANDGFVTQEQYRTMVSKLSVPLRDSMLKLHDPNQLNEIKKSGRFMGMFQHTEEPDHVVDKYVGGYNVINNWMKAQGKSDDWASKSQAVQKYMEMSDAVKPEDRDPQGRPFTPETVARKAMGIADGDNIQTPFGLKKITGYDSASGTPKYEISDEEQSRFIMAKVLMKIGKK